MIFLHNKRMLAFAKISNPPGCVILRAPLGSLRCPWKAIRTILDFWRFEMMTDESDIGAMLKRSD